MAYQYQYETIAKALETYLAICEFMSARSDNLVDRNAWYLSIIGILPRHQGKGLGPGIITPMLEHTDKLNVATFLETFTPRNMPFYERLGYCSAGSFKEPTTKAEYRVMVRLPNQKPNLSDN